MPDDRRRLIKLALMAALCSGCVSRDMLAEARLRCWNDMQMAATRADSVAVLHTVAYSSVADGATMCAHIIDSLPKRK